MARDTSITQSLVTVTGKDTHRYILQRINTDIFTDPSALMENICGVTSYLKEIIAKRGGDTTRETMTVVYTRNGKPGMPLPRWKLRHCMGYKTDDTGVWHTLSDRLPGR